LRCLSQSGFSDFELLKEMAGASLKVIGAFEKFGEKTSEFLRFFEKSLCLFGMRN